MQVFYAIGLLIAFYFVLIAEFFLPTGGFLGAVAVAILIAAAVIANADELSSDEDIPLINARYLDPDDTLNDSIVSDRPQQSPEVILSAARAVAEMTVTKQISALHHDLEHRVRQRMMFALFIGAFYCLMSAAGGAVAAVWMLDSSPTLRGALLTPPENRTFASANLVTEVGALVVGASVEGPARSRSVHSAEGAVTNSAETNTPRPTASDSQTPATSDLQAPAPAEPQTPATPDSQTPTNTEVPLDASADDETSPLPDQVVIPIGFESGRFHPIMLDNDEVSRLTNAMLAVRTANFEVIGFAIPGEASTPRRRRRLARRRAKIVRDIICSRGPSRRRLSYRAARADDPLPEGLTTSGDAPIGATLLRVTR